MTTYYLFITCPRGLETLLADELTLLGCGDIQPGDGGVAAKGTMEAVYRINLHSRVASRVLLQLTKGAYRSEQDIYKLARNIRWSQWFAVENTFKVQANKQKHHQTVFEITAATGGKIHQQRQYHQNKADHRDSCHIKGKGLSVS